MGHGSKKRLHCEVPLTRQLLPVFLPNLTFLTSRPFPGTWLLPPPLRPGFSPSLLLFCSPLPSSPPFSFLLSSSSPRTEPTASRLLSKSTITKLYPAFPIHVFFSKGFTKSPTMAQVELKLVIPLPQLQSNWLALSCWTEDTLEGDDFSL